MSWNNSFKLYIKIIHSSTKTNFWKEILWLYSGYSQYFFNGDRSALKQEVGCFLKNWSWCWRRRVHIVLLFLNHNWNFRHWTHLRIFESCSGKSVHAWPENCIHDQVKSLRVRLNLLQIGYIETVCAYGLCAYTWEYFNPHLHSSLLTGVFETRPIWLFRNSCFWDKKSLKPA